MARRAVVVASAVPMVVSAYLVTLLAAAVRGARRRPPAPGALPPFLVLVPAHDEEAVIAPTLASLRALDYPAELIEVVVIADNCRDATAVTAGAHGATVIERDDPQRRGKGHALAWALSVCEHRGRAVAVVDADCHPSPNLLRAAAARFAAGASCVQADYRVANPDASTPAALRYAAFALVNTVRPLGKSELGLSCGLLGTGMAFAPGLLERSPWDAFSLAEDAEYHIRLVDRGERVVFCPEARVESPMPTTHGAAASQQSRWEAGRTALARRAALPLLGRGIRRRDPQRAHTALEAGLPPLSLLAGATLVIGGLAAALRVRGAAGACAAAAACQGLYVTGGLALARAPAAVWRALVLAPGLAARKLAIYARIGTGAGPNAWVRTAREAATPAQAKSASVGNT